MARDPSVPRRVPGACNDCSAPTPPKRARCEACLALARARARARYVPVLARALDTLARNIVVAGALARAHAQGFADAIAVKRPV